ncbi:unnamed protein product [Amoebophrya sp. A120]|nr:unnamed protein product [Amoebophrya sp. A120]|eukprot:GSA120T00023744001.1
MAWRLLDVNSFCLVRLLRLALLCRKKKNDPSNTVRAVCFYCPRTITTTLLVFFLILLPLQLSFALVRREQLDNDTTALVPRIVGSGATSEADGATTGLQPDKSRERSSGASGDINNYIQTDESAKNVFIRSPFPRSRSKGAAEVKTKAEQTAKIGVFLDHEGSEGGGYRYDGTNDGGRTTTRREDQEANDHDQSSGPTSRTTLHLSRPSPTATTSPEVPSGKGGHEINTTPRPRGRRPDDGTGHHDVRQEDRSLTTTRNATATPSAATSRPISSSTSLHRTRPGQVTRVATSASQVDQQDLGALAGDARESASTASRQVYVDTKEVPIHIGPFGQITLQWRRDDSVDNAAIWSSKSCEGAGRFALGLACGRASLNVVDGDLGLTACAPDAEQSGDKGKYTVGRVASANDKDAMDFMFGAGVCVADAVKDGGKMTSPSSYRKTSQTALSVEMNCPTGTEVVGGGCYISSSSNCYLKETRPKVEGWKCQQICPSSIDTMTAVAICVRSDFGRYVFKEELTTSNPPGHPAGDDTSWWTRTVSCPRHTYIIGGGCAILPNNNDPDNFLAASYFVNVDSTSSSSTPGFKCTSKKVTWEDGTNNAYALCATPIATCSEWHDSTILATKLQCEAGQTYDVSKALTLCSAAGKTCTAADRPRCCKQVECVCDHGTPVALGHTSCPGDGQSRCTDCADGYHLNEDMVCVANQCICIHGHAVAAGAVACDQDGAERCTEDCNAGFELNPDSKACEKKTCTCPRGTGAEGEKCPAQGAHACKTCEDGYLLRNNDADIPICKKKCSSLGSSALSTGAASASVLSAASSFYHKEGRTSHMARTRGTARRPAASRPPSPTRLEVFERERDERRPDDVLQQAEQHDYILTLGPPPADDKAAAGGSVTPSAPTSASVSERRLRRVSPAIGHGNEGRYGFDADDVVEVGEDTSRSKNIPDTRISAASSLTTSTPTADGASSTSTATRVGDDDGADVDVDPAHSIHLTSTTPGVVAQTETTSNRSSGPSSLSRLASSSSNAMLTSAKTQTEADICVNRTAEQVKEEEESAGADETTLTGTQATQVLREYDEVNGPEADIPTCASHECVPEKDAITCCMLLCESLLPVVENYCSVDEELLLDQPCEPHRECTKEICCLLKPVVAGKSTSLNTADEGMASFAGVDTTNSIRLLLGVIALGVMGVYFYGDVVGGGGDGDGEPPP